jgi:hypothetical protein
VLSILVIIYIYHTTFNSLFITYRHSSSCQIPFLWLRKIAAVHLALYGAMYIFPCENNADGQPIVRLYTQVDRMTGTKSKELPWKAKEQITAEDIMQADKNVPVVSSKYQLDVDR